MPVYNLVPDRDRGGLAKAAPGSCTPPDNSVGSNEPPDSRAAPSCGFSARTIRDGLGPVIQLHARAVTSVLIARVLGTTLGRQVNDQTQMEGTFDFVLEYAPEPKSATDGTADAAPSLFTALREQLGLKLESARGPVDVLVVGRVTKPSEN